MALALSSSYFSSYRYLNFTEPYLFAATEPVCMYMYSLTPLTCACLHVHVLYVQLHTVVSWLMDYLHFTTHHIPLIFSLVCSFPRSSIPSSLTDQHFATSSLTTTSHHIITSRSHHILSHLASIFFGIYISPHLASFFCIHISPLRLTFIFHPHPLNLVTLSCAGRNKCFVH